MLKMTIDNEEVVSDKDITINEEMLSASSTILNNVYPKEWEEDKNYTSRFYYPQDYSKALIQRSYVTQEAEAGTTIQVNGSVTLNDVDTTKNSRVLRLLGQTSQSGTPTPSSPIPVNVVSGDNEIVIVGKNLFIPTLKVDDSNISTTRCTVSLSDDEYTFSATGNDMYFGNIVASGTAYQNIFGTLYDVEGITNLVFKPTNTDFDKNFVCYYDKNKVSLGYVQINNSTGLITPVVNTKYIGFRIGKGGSVSGTSYSTKFQLEKGSSASTYEPYQGNTYNIDLPVENLLPTEVSAWEQGSFNPADGSNTSSTTRLRTIDYYPIKNDIDYYVSVQNTTYCFLNIMLYDNSKSFVGQYFNVNQNINGATSLKIKIPSSSMPNVAYMKVLLRNADNTSTITPSEITTIKPQIELGNKQNSFTPYGTTPIELCKIGNYQDYIYKDSDKWYLHKEIGKYTYNGTETFTNPSSIDTPTPRHSFQGSLNFIRCLNNNYLSNYFIKDNTGSNRFVITFSGGAGSDCTVFIALENSITGITSSDTNATKIQKLKDWLSTHNTNVYYILATPTTTEITDTTLISQLNALSSQ